jgi:hypothetical protein
MDQITPERVILFVIVICGLLSNFFKPTSKIGQVLSTIGSLSVRSSMAAPPSASKIASTSILFLLCSGLTNCVPAKKVWDTAYDTCVASLQVQAVIIQVAGKKAIPVLEYAKAACQVMAVLDPFVQDLSEGNKVGASNATEKALAAAKEHGLLE